MRSLLPLLLLTVTGAGVPAQPTGFETRVVMSERAAATYYVPAAIAGVAELELMVDTGSGYVTINELTLAALKQPGKTRYVKQLRGVLADGSELVVPVYLIERLRIGADCWLKDVEAAVFPGNARQLLGLSALPKTAPFIFSIDPPELVLSQCSARSPHGESGRLAPPSQ